MNNFDKSEAVLSQLIAAAAKNLGVTPEQLRAELESGRLEQSLKNSSDPRLQSIKRVLNDGSIKSNAESTADELWKKYKKGGGR